MMRCTLGTMPDQLPAAIISIRKLIITNTISFLDKHSSQIHIQYFYASVLLFIMNYIITIQSHSQSPLYPYPSAGMGNKDLCDKAFHHDRNLGLPVLLRMCSTPCFKATHKILGLPVLLCMSGGKLYPRGPCCPFLPPDKGNEDSGKEIDNNIY